MYRVAIIGVGKGGENIGSHSIGYMHAQTYVNSGRCKIVGAADISEENLNAFADKFGVACTSPDYRTMLAEARPQLVSVATYAGLRREMVMACIEAGVKGIWCEKPFCLTMDDGRAMLDACHRNDVKLIVNHQRRYLHAFHEAKRLLADGAIGSPVTFEGGIQGGDLMEWGTHWFDMFRFFADEKPVSWVMGQARCTGEKRGYGHVMEEHAVAYFAFDDGTRGLLDGSIAFNAHIALRLTGTEGLIDLFHDGTVRVLNSNGWQHVPTRSTLHDARTGFEAESPWLAILNALIAWVEGGPEPMVSGANAIFSSELYLAAYESARRGDRVDLPLGNQHEFPLEPTRHIKTASPT